jgi:putrescine transport system substrate-binding protein
MLAAAGLAVATSAGAQERVVNVYNWSDYVLDEADDSVLKDFTDETGIKVVYDTYDNNEIVETKLMAGGSGYDIVVPSNLNLAREIAAGTLRKLDKSKLPNLTHMWPLIMERLATYDPGNQYAVDYMWGTTGLGYNADMVAERIPDAPVDSWALLFDPQYASKLADCGIDLLDSPDDVLPSALAYLGLPPDSKDQANLDKAAELLQKVRPYIQKFHSSEYINGLANGDICLALGYSGDVFQARDRADEAGNGVTVAYSIPKEGALMWFDSMAIPKDAPHPDEAHEFINFMMRPDIAARNSNYVYYANGNIDSQDQLEEDVAGDPAIYPAQDVLDKLFVTTPADAGAQRIITRLWTRLKAGS